MGHLAVGNIATGETFMVEQVVGSPKGETAEAQVVGNTVLFGRYDGEKSDWWVYQDDHVQPLLGGTDVDVHFLVTDGVRIVWKLGTQPYLDNGKKRFARYDLYWAPYTTDAAALQPSLLLPEVPPSLGNAVIENGHLAANYLTAKAPDATGAIVVRLADGLALRSILPEKYNWGLSQFPAANELWGTATKTPNFQYGQTAVRIPYAAMDVLQASMPDGG
jgi:hypothetical protein